PPARPPPPVRDPRQAPPTGRDPGPGHLLLHLGPDQFGVEGPAGRRLVAAVPDPQHHRPGVAVRADPEPDLPGPARRQPLPPQPHLGGYPRVLAVAVVAEDDHRHLRIVGVR